jgi:hypothetical protein
MFAGSRHDASANENCQTTRSDAGNELWYPHREVEADANVGGNRRRYHAGGSRSRAIVTKEV